jgi:anaerobic selenocysteine-containing dehydrogenase
VENGVITRVRSDPANPMTRGYLCNKAPAIRHYVRHAQRLRYPLARHGPDDYRRIGWTRAVSEIGERLAAIRARHGPQSIALVGVGGQGNHLDSPYALAFLQGLGSPWWLNSMAQEKTQHLLVDRWMLRAEPTSYLHADTRHCQLLLVIGTNPLVSNRSRNPRRALRAISDDPDRTLVVVDPRVSETAEIADLHLRVRPGTDTYLLLGLVAEIVRRDLHDRRFIEEWTTGLADVSPVLRQIDPAIMADRSGIDLPELSAVAERFATAASAAVFWDLGVEQVPHSTLNSYLVRLLLALTGNLGAKGGNRYYSMFTPALGSRWEPEVYRAPVSGIQSIAAFSPVPMFSPSLLAEEIERDHPGRIRAVIVEGANPLLTVADTSRLRAALKRLELLVVIDPALTETAREADYVLPAPVGYEKWEWSGFPNAFPEIYVQLRPPVVPAPEEAHSEAEIFCRLAEAVGLVPDPPRLLRWLAPVAGRPWGAAAVLVSGWVLARLRSSSAKVATARQLFWAYRTVGPRLTAPALAAMWVNCHLFALTRRRDLLRTLGRRFRFRSPWGLGKILFERLLRHPEGIEAARVDASAHLESICNYRDGRVRLAPRPMVEEVVRLLAEPVPPVDEEYPLLLYTGERRPWNANTILRDPSWRKGRGPHCTVRIHSQDAERAGVRSGEQIRLETRRGAVSLPAQVDDRVHPGQLSAPAGFGLLYPDPQGSLREDGVNLNQLTDAGQRDPITGVPYHKHVHCRVVRDRAPSG